MKTALLTIILGIVCGIFFYEEQTDIIREGLIYEWNYYDASLLVFVGDSIYYQDYEMSPEEIKTRYVALFSSDSLVYTDTGIVYEKPRDSIWVDVTDKDTSNNSEVKK